jgi:biotin operon repressor
MTAYRHPNEYAVLELLNEKPKTQSMLVHETGLSESAIWRRIKTLRSKGLIRIVEYRLPGISTRVPVWGLQ